MSFPTVAEMVQSHTLAQNIITRHNTDDDVLDDAELSFLEAWVTDPSKANALLSERGITPSDYKGSLVGYAIQKGVFSPDEVEALKTWFANGRAQEHT